MKDKDFNQFPKSQDKHLRDNPGCLKIDCLHQENVHFLLTVGEMNQPARKPTAY